MKEIKLKSRYGDTHTLVPVDGYGENVYKYTPAKDWMQMRYIFDGEWNGEDKELVAVDTDGGPFLSAGDVVEGKPIKRVFYKKGCGALIEF